MSATGSVGALGIELMVFNNTKEMVLSYSMLVATVPSRYLS